MLAPPKTPSSFSTALLFLICTLIYSGSLNNDWHFDDIPNIVNNNAIHIETFSFSQLTKTLHAHPEKEQKLYRPVAVLSFGINWFVHKDAVIGYHLVNVGIHFITAVILYFTCQLLLQTPVSKKYYQNQEHVQDIALLTASLWLIAPAHTQTVTYIVQRMAQLATLFTVLSIFLYLRFRISQNTKERFWVLIGLFISALLAFGSKENAYMLPASLLLIEVIFFNHNYNSFRQHCSNNVHIIATILILVIFTFLFFFGQYGFNLLDYDHRNFTLGERLLTEPRVILQYIVQLLIPLRKLLSIEHDFTISTSLFSPWQTFPVIITFMGLFFLTLKTCRRFPIYSFAVLFFFLNMLIESSLLPLEIIYEHRIYLPSLFFFLPVSIVIITLITCRYENNLLKKYLIVLFTVLFLIVSGINTFNRTEDWKSELTLWRDAANKAPLSGRANLNLAKALIETDNLEEASAILNKKNLTPGPTKNKQDAVLHYLKSAIFYKTGEIEKAVVYLKNALSLQNNYAAARHELLRILVEHKHFDEALTIVTGYLDNNYNRDIAIIRAILLLKNNRPEECLLYLQKINFSAHSLPIVATINGQALNMLGYSSNAGLNLHYAVLTQQPSAIYCYLEHLIRSDKSNMVQNTIENLTSTIPLNIFFRDIEEKQSRLFAIPFNKQLIKNELYEFLRKTTPY